MLDYLIYNIFVIFKTNAGVCHTLVYLTYTNMWVLWDVKGVRKVYEMLILHCLRVERLKIKEMNTKHSVLYENLSKMCNPVSYFMQLKTVQNHHRNNLQLVRILEFSTAEETNFRVQVSLGQTSSSWECDTLVTSQCTGSVTSLSQTSPPAVNRGERCAVWSEWVFQYLRT